jgi:hypothetical protein
MAAALAPLAPIGSILREQDTHRGWTINYDHPPIPCRDFDWSATSPDYDCSYEGPEDGWFTSGSIVHGRTRDDVVAEIDASIAEQQS